jgi:hypothetical protein
VLDVRTMLDGKQTNHIHHTLNNHSTINIHTNTTGMGILKTYQHPDKEKTNQYARWYVAARSPLTHGSWEYGDTYATEIQQYGRLL